MTHEMKPKQTSPPLPLWWKCVLFPLLSLAKGQGFAQMHFLLKWALAALSCRQEALCSLPSGGQETPPPTQAGTKDQGRQPSQRITEHHIIKKTHLVISL